MDGSAIGAFCAGATSTICSDDSNRRVETSSLILNGFFSVQPAPNAMGRPRRRACAPLERTTRCYANMHIGQNPPAGRTTLFEANMAESKAAGGSDYSASIMSSGEAAQANRATILSSIVGPLWFKQTANHSEYRAGQMSAFRARSNPTERQA